MYTLFHTTKPLINTNLSDDNYKADGQLEKFEESKKIYRQQVKCLKVLKTQERQPKRADN